MTALTDLVLTWIAAGVLAVLVHEAGHALAALLVGGRRMRLHRDGIGLALHAEVPGPSWRRLCFYAGGIAANVVAIGVGAFVGGVFGAALVGMNLLFALVQLRGAGSDGAQALEAWRGSRGVEVR